jgi:hypothetical protein
MSAFPQFSNVYDSVQTTIKSRLGKNYEVSKLKPWIRITSGYGAGLVIGSNLANDSFYNRYGDSNNEGRVGNNFAGNPVFASQNSTFRRGLRPSPVIESINIKNGSEGLSRKLTFQIKCFSLPQLDTLTAYFLEPRFYLLAEWGWNTNDAYSQLAKVQGVDTGTAICDIISYINLGVLKDKRANSKGQYDAFLGVITGGGVEYGEDETYLISVEVTTQGEIPAYLQQHKGTGTTLGSKTDNKSSKPFDVEKEIATAEELKKFGRALFMYMYNDLPGGKQIEKIKKFVDDPYWVNEYHYINMNKTLRDSMLESVSDVSVNLLPKGNDETFVEGTIPSDQPLISKERFIRMELAWKILNTSDMLLEPTEISCTKKGSNKGLDSEISIENTIIRAHKHMFSANKEYLYIPNQTGLDFGLEEVLSQTSDLTSGSFLRLNDDGSFVEKNYAPNDLPLDNAFPQLGPLIRNAAKEYDDTFEPLRCESYKWGYLKDLFINFDFFIQCMDRNGYVIKDVALELLNGLSSAVNLFWDFQIVETGSTSATKGNVGDMCLIVADRSFTGEPPTARKSLLSLQTIGTTSPFLEFNIKMELGGALANQVMAQRTSEMSPGVGTDINVESKPEAFQGLFASVPDGVTKKLNTIRTQMDLERAKQESEAIANSSRTELENAKAELERKIAANEDNIGDHWAVGNAEFQAGNYWDAFSAYASGVGEGFEDLYEGAVELGTNIVTGESTEERKQRASNYEFFMQKAGVYPKINDPESDFAKEFWTDWNSSNDTTISDSTLICAIWEDSQLLRQIYEYDLTPSKKPIDVQKELKKTPGYLPVEANFTIHGVSGLKVGDLIHFKDVPHVYRTKLFTVFEVEQTINDDIWQTSVVTKLRNITL